MKRHIILFLAAMSVVISCKNNLTEKTGIPGFRLEAADTIHFNSFVDCNMAEAWIGDTFRIFPGKYAEDPVLKFIVNFALLSRLLFSPAPILIEGLYKAILTLYN